MSLPKEEYMLEVTSAKLTGSPGVSGWSQIHEFTPEDPDKLRARGKLFAVVATSRVQDAGVDTIATGRELIARIHEAYYGDITLKPFNALRLAVEKVVEEFGNSWGDVEIAACSWVGGVVYSAAVGGAEVTVSRKGILGTILRSTDTKTIQASGFPQEGDNILLATKKFHEAVPLGIIKAGLESGNPEVSIETFGPRVHSEGNGSLAAVVIRFGQKSEKVVNLSTPNQVNAQLKSDVFKINILDFFTRLSKKLPQRQIYVKPTVDDEVVSQNKKTTFSIALILLVILGVSIAFGVRQKKINDTRGTYESLLSSAEQDVSEAIALASISPDRSRELFYESDQKLREVEGMEIKDPKVVDLRKKIDEARAQVLGEYIVGEELFLDLSLLSSGFKSDELAASAGAFYILDKSGKRIVSVEISSKKSRVLAGPNILDEVRGIAAYEGRVFVLSGDGVYEIETGKTKVIDSTWSGEVLIRAFAGNIYVLDKVANNIYRYAGQGSTFGSQQNWLAGGTNADFSNAVSWIIDGSVYVLYPNSKISKFSLGSPQSFSIKSVVPQIGSINSIFTSDENEYIYLLDSAGKRIVVVDKKGVYKAQYKNELIGSASNMVVSEVDKKIIILVGDKLYSMNTAHF